MRSSAETVPRRIRRFLGGPPRDITQVSLDWPLDVGFPRNISLRKVPLSGTHIRVMVLRLIRKETAKSKLRRLMRPHAAYTGVGAREGDCVLCYRSVTKHSTSRWCGPSEVVGVEPDAMALSYLSCIREVPRNWEKSSVFPTTQPCEGPIGPPPLAVKKPHSGQI